MDPGRAGPTTWLSDPRRATLTATGQRHRLAHGGTRARPGDRVDPAPARRVRRGAEGARGTAGPASAIPRRPRVADRARAGRRHRGLAGGGDGGPVPGAVRGPHRRVPGALGEHQGPARRLRPGLRQRVGHGRLRQAAGEVRRVPKPGLHPGLGRCRRGPPARRGPRTAASRRVGGLRGRGLPPAAGRDLPLPRCRLRWRGLGARCARLPRDLPPPRRLRRA